MTGTLKRILFPAALATVLLAAPLAGAVEVTFQVRMARQVELGAFDPTLDFVDVAGTFNGWGDDPLTPLADADDDTIYAVAVDGFTPGAVIEFKFRINGLWDGTEEFPGYGANRVYTVQETGNLVDVWYNDSAPGGDAGGGETYWWNDAVFYEIFVRSFQDSDGDGIGDLPGLTSRLDYLNDGDPDTDTDLGVTGIWLMPINDSPSYHGYDSTDYRSINPDYGTMADFEAFLAAAHERGIRVIVDYVMNHCSNQHPWFVASAQNDPQYRDWFRWSATDPGETGPWGQQVWHWDASGWYYGLFWSGMPDLNYSTAAVKTEMFDTATYWLDTVGVDGFRLDAVLYIDEDAGQLQNTNETLQFWQDFNAHVKAVKPDALSVGEAWTNSNTVVQYVIDDRLDFCFEFDLAFTTLGAVNSGDADGLGGLASYVYGLYPYLQFGTFLSNHDHDRSFQVLGEDVGRAKAAAGIYLTLPGVPFLYYGEEVGMVGGGSDEYKRSPMQWSDDLYGGFSTAAPWLALNGNFAEWNVAVEEPDPGSLLNWYRKLIRVRNENPALRRGEFARLGASVTPVLAFVRRDETQTLLCLVNTSAATQGSVSLSGLEGSLAPGEYDATDLLDAAGGQVLTVTPDYRITGLQLDAHQVAVYEMVTVTGAGEPGPPRTGLRLEQNSPNPFNPSTTIRYTLPVDTHVRLGIFDVSGREVAVLADGVQKAGSREVRWNGRSPRGLPVASGTYFARLETGIGTEVRKLLMIK